MASTVTFLVVVLFAAAQAAVPADEIAALPGWNQALPSKQYSGYLSVTGSTKFLHYWFVESENDPVNDPVVAWFNGGPGCSSLDGYLYEHGPFHVNDSNTNQLYYNNHTWAKVANMLYIESPAGVGFSYAESPSEYIFNDTQSAEDNYAAVESFFASYPEYLANEFFITGESYAGVYVPMLADQIRQHQEDGSTKINLKGIAVGNGCTGNQIGICSSAGTQIRADYFYNHATFSTKLYNQINDACGDFNPPLSSKCNDALNTMSQEIGYVDIYFIYGKCIVGDEPRVHNSTVYSRAPIPRMGGPLGGPVECIDSISASAYLNQPAVQAAIHVKPPCSGKWAVCNNCIQYTSTEPNLPRDIYPGLIQKYKVLIYNGDSDGCVPYTDNEKWTTSMGFSELEAWRPWLNEGQVGGYVTTYDTPFNFTFLTIKGAGHMVPQIKPGMAFYFFEHFISGTPF